MDHVVAADEPFAARPVDLAGVEVLDGRSQLESKARSVEQFAVGDLETNAFDTYAFEVRLGGSEGDRVDANAGDLAAVQIGGELAADDEVGADLGEGRLGPASDGEVLRKLHHAKAGIERRGGEAAHVRRGIDPGQAGGVE